VTVPFFYNFGGDERFLQDYFLHWNDCAPQLVDGNVDPIPRGIATLSSSTINTNMLTNRFVRGNYVKQVGGEVLTYSAFLNSIPLTMNFDVEIYTDTSLDAFKIQQAMLETFYKTQVFSVEFKGFRVPCQVGFPEDQAIQKTFEFTYQGDTTIKFASALQLETYYPVTDPTTERFSGNRMNYPGGPNFNLISDEKYSLPRFKFTSPGYGETYFSSSIMPIQWSNTGPISRVNLYYRIVGTSNWVPIGLNIQNTGVYNWSIPFFNTAGAEVNGEPINASAISNTGSGAKLRAIIGSNQGVNFIVILEGGSAYEGTDSIIVTELNVSEPLDYMQANATPSVVGGEIIGYNLTFAGASLPITPINQIELKIEDSNNENVWQELKYDPTFLGNTTSGTNIINSISPLLNSQGLFLGQTVNGPGIPVDAKITNINTTSGQIAFTPGTASASATAQSFVANESPVYITIM